MSAVPVTMGQRHTRRNPCKICGGHADMPQGKGRRCAGFLSADGDYERCQREQYAGRLELDERTTPPTYAHKMHGECRCGVTHAPGAYHRSQQAPVAVHPKIQWKETGRWPGFDVKTGEKMADHVRQDPYDAGGKRIPKGTVKKKMWWSPSGVVTGKLEQLALYNAEALTSGVIAIVLEGELKTDETNEQLRRAGRTDIVAVGTMTGSGVTPCDEALRPLVGCREVWLWADNADDGRLHMERNAERLQKMGAPALKWVRWQDAPPKGDAADYFAGGGTVEHLLELVEERPAKQSTEQPKMPNPPIDAHSGDRASMGILDEDGHLRRGFIRLSDVEPEQVQWLWQGRIPLGKLTIIDGDPDLGKSIVFGADIAARITQGMCMPDGSPGLGEPAGVVLLSAEDDVADTIRPRLDAAGADATRVLAIYTVPRFRTNKEDGTVTVEEGSFALPRDIEWLRQAIEHTGARYVLIDPLMAYLNPGEVNSYRDQDIRTALAPLSRLAAETGCAIVAIRHLNKGTATNALYRGGGSIGISAAARSVLLVAADPNDESKQRRILARSKGNLSAPVPSLAYHIAVTENSVPYIVWEGETDHTASQLLSLPVDEETRSATGEAMEWLRAVLTDAGGQMPAKDVQTRARQDGITDKVLRSARQNICETTKEGFGATGVWTWRLAPKMPSPPKMPIDAHISEVGTLDDSGHLRTCSVTGGAHVYAKMRTADGRRVCLECDGPEGAKEAS